MGADHLSRIWSGAMRLLRWGLLWLLVGFSPAAAEVPEDIQQLLQHRGHALLIGVSEYTSGWPQLPNVKNDLQDLKAGLEPYFATVDIVPNPTVAQLRDRMSEFLLGQWNNPGERLFIYYSGHGFTAFNQSSRDYDGYITGSDTPGKAVVKAVSFYEVDSWSRQTSARHVLMVFDSCFSGSLFQTTGLPEEPPHNDLDNVRTLLRKPMRYYVTAGHQNEEVAADSTFAALLLRGLRGEADKYHEGIISAEELGSYLYHEVPKYSPRPQTPQFKSIGNARLSEGQFYFLTPPAAPRGERRVVAYANGDRYEGELLDDKRNGRGVYTVANGDRYDGEFLDNKKNGHGMSTYANGSRYDGEFLDNKKNGRGVYTDANGDRYDGEFRDDTYSGHGVYTWPDGRRYVGEWRDGKAVSSVGR